MEFDEFLKEVAPLLGFRWRPFNRRGIKRKVERRIADIRVSGFDEYLLKVRGDREEQSHLSQILTVTISRYFRDREAFMTIETTLIPILLENKSKKDLKLWSIGCASGEEPYSLSILWKEIFIKDWPEVRLSILATDINEYLLQRAKEGRYKKSSLKEVPEEVRRKHFRLENGFYVLDHEIMESVDFRRHDILREEPFPGMDMVLCRNCAFTYFSKDSQIEVLKRIASSLGRVGYLVIGKDELLPLTFPTLFVPIFPQENIYQRFKMDPVS